MGFNYTRFQQEKYISKYRYSDYNYAVIALIIEEVEKKTFKEIMMKYIQEELSMKHTFYASTVFTKDDNYSWLWEDDNPFSASGGLFSNVDDMMMYLDYQKQHNDKLKISHANIIIRIRRKIFTLDFRGTHFLMGISIGT